MEIAFVAQGLRISIPYVLASLGGMFSERGGVVNIALEGIMLAGAFGFAIGAYFGQAPELGVLAALLVGLAVAGVHAIVTIRFRGEQIVSGIAINLTMLGATDFTLKLVFGSSSNSPRIVGFDPGAVSGLSAIPVVGPTLSHPLVLATLLIAVASHVVLYRTRFGLRLRAVGEHAVAAASLGIRVRRVRTAGVLASGLLAGLAGAYLASEQASFTSGMTAGRGYIALAAMIVGKWRPGGAVLASLVFGFAEALQIRLQTSLGVDVPSHVVQMIPYVLTLVVLCGFIGRSTPPGNVGVPYDEESRA